MASLALLVSLIFLVTLLLGPLSLLFSFFNLKVLAVIFGVCALGVGLFWCSVAPFPVSLVGAFCIICGALAIKNF